MRKNIHQPQLSRTGNPTSAFSDRELKTCWGGFGSGGGERLSVTVKWSPPGRIPVALSPEASGVGYLFAVQKGAENSWFPNLLANLFNNLPKGVYRTLHPHATVLRGNGRLWRWWASSCCHWGFRLFARL